MKQFFFSLIIMLALCPLIHAQENETLQQTASWAATVQQAKKENKLIFVDCYFTGCHPCAQMDKEVFPNEMVRKEMAEHFIGIKVDVFKEKLGDTLNMKYAVGGFPTFLILNSSGKLISMFNGYQDASMLMQQLDAAKQKAASKKFLTGFDVSNQLSYPDFYKKYYDRADRKSDPVAANAWIKQQKDWTSEQVALAILKTGKLDMEVEDYLLANYAKYKAMYGQSLVLDKTAAILNNRVVKEVNKQKDEETFQQFLTKNAKNFPTEDWKILRFLLGYHYYGSIAKDTTLLLTFMIKEPVIYMNYFGALYNNLSVKGQLNENTLKLLCEWVTKAVKPGESISIMETAASICKENNDMGGYKRFVKMAIETARKYNMPADAYEKMLQISP